ncbi:alpha-L-fucosidase [Luethyella okanaganae]|uniref:alpha-L-fucosidase n=1 Tax=Luethyella okanaganae TaxID=69372 RepID=A0ABW1VGC0_9MICO
MKNRSRRSVVGAFAALATGAISLTALPANAVTPTDDYLPNEQSLSTHDAPDWYNDAKLGYFIHWGPYSVPAYSADKDGAASYAEHYLRKMNEVGSDTYEHHKATYGTEYAYDDFITDWKPDKFDPEAWVDLFEQGGAKYFVSVTKHHDGVALWDTKTTDRDTVALGPKRDLTKELMDAAADSPLKKGLYYSMIEWFHPQGGQIKKGMSNPYTGAPIEYRGYTPLPDTGDPVNDYVMGQQYPQMKELVANFDPDLIWCDSNGPNNSNQFMAEYYNQAKNRAVPKDVVVNDRCGNWVGDFATPEYEVKDVITPAKWESTRGLGGSFGYNAEEDIEDYLSSDELIDGFVDVVSKNGNLLLNIGPKADGTIPAVQAERVRSLGDWLRINGEAIYGTTYWGTAEDDASNVPVRYTVKDGALYVTALEWPGEKLTLSGGLPLLPKGSSVKLLGSKAKLTWSQNADGTVSIPMPANGAASTASKDAYTFKIASKGIDQLNRLSVDVPATTAGPFTAKVTLSNAGAAASAAGQVALSVPEGWTTEPATIDVPALAPGEVRSYDFNVNLPTENPPAGDFRIEASATFGKLTYRAHDLTRLGVENAAQGKAATQSSTANGGVASRAVDGNTNGAFGNGSVTHTAEPSNQAWWQADLGTVRDILDIDVWNRTDCCGIRLSDYNVFVSDTPITGGTVAEVVADPAVRNYPQTATAGSPTRVKIGGTGRYVRIQLNSPTLPLSLAEVQVNSPKLLGAEADQNLALGKPAIQSSSTSTTSGIASLAVDGITDGRWGEGSVTHTQPSNEPWWQVDLGSNAAVTAIDLWNRTDCCGSRLSKYHVFVSETPFTGNSVAESLAQPGVRDFYQDATAGSATRIDVGGTGRYVRVQLTSSDQPLSIAEVQVWGQPGTN